MGVAVQLGSLRMLGMFLDDPTLVPPSVMRFAANQLAMSASTDLTIMYAASVGRWRDGPRIRERYGYRGFADFGVAFRLNRFLYALCGNGTDRPSALFDRAVSWLLAGKVLLPGLSVLERAVARTRSRVHEHLHRRLVERLTLAAGLPELDRIPPSKAPALARFASAAKAQAVARLPDDRRAATLVAFIRTLEASAEVCPPSAPMAQI
jgi:hypothetical protein